MTMVSLVANGLIATFGMLILGAGGAVLIVRRGRLYALFILAAVLLFFGSLAGNVYGLVVNLAVQSGTSLDVFGSLWVSLAIGLIASTVSALAWLAVLIPLMRPDVRLDEERDGPLAEGGA